ncbi:MAG: anti-phage dCTP deaminase [Candidatus Omnitrophota bacterium]
MKKTYHSEIFLGLVAPVGTDLNHICDRIQNFLSGHYKYNPQLIRLSDLIHRVGGVKTKIDTSSEYNRINSAMTAGNEARSGEERSDILARCSILEIQKLRGLNQPTQNNVYIIRSIKTPGEANVFRTVYGRGYFQLGFFSSRKDRIEYLHKIEGMTKDEANKLINRDEDENDEFGQQARNSFHGSDVFFDVNDKDFDGHLKRFFDLIFGSPYITPTKDEFNMHLAFTSSFRSCDLSRQVGAVVVNQDGEIISTGCNDVPKFGGGLYWADDPNDARDFLKGFDPNEKEQNRIATRIVDKVQKLVKDKKNFVKEIGEILNESGIFEITEYGRIVHAEMDALLTCSRIGVSPKGGTLYTTTYPCHNCAKHIIASGIKRVVFIEPYQKSKAIQLHSDSLGSGKQKDEVVLSTFIGVGPRRFIDLFSLNFSNGIKIKRKEKGKIVEWKEQNALFRFPLLGLSYLDKEISIGGELGKGLENAKKQKAIKKR